MPLFFVLIPYFTERQQAMRIPVVTFVTMALCLLTLIFVRPAIFIHDVESEEALQAAVYYARGHGGVDDSELMAMCEDMGRPGCTWGYDAEEAEALILEELGEAFPDLFGSAEREGPPPGDQAALDALVAVAHEAWQGQPFVRFGLVRGEFRLHGLITHQFLHAGWLHLLGNLLFMWLAMSSLENVWSRGVLVAVYLAGGAIAGAVQLLFMGDVPLVPLVGASGAVAALMGAYLVCFARSRIRMWYFVLIFFHVRTGTFQWPAWVALPLWFAYQLLSWLGLGAGDVGYAAHIGGFAFGAAGAFAFTRSGIYDRLSWVPESDMPLVRKEARGDRIPYPRKTDAPLPPPPPAPASRPTDGSAAAPWDEPKAAVEPPPEPVAPVKILPQRPDDLQIDDSPSDLVANIHDWMASTDAGAEGPPAPAEQVPWTDEDVPATSPRTPWTDDAMPVTAPPVAPRPAPAKPGGSAQQPPLQPPLPPAEGVPTDESLMVSAPWGRVTHPDEEEEEGGGAQEQATLRRRTSQLVAIESQRLSLLTADGAPFKVPLEQIYGIFPGLVGADAPTRVCDLVHGVHRTGGGVLIETVRLPDDLQPYDKLLARAPAAGDDPFEALMIQLREDLTFVRTWPGSLPGQPLALPVFANMDEFENALLAHIARED